MKIEKVYTPDNAEETPKPLVIQPKIWFDFNLTGNQKLILALVKVLESKDCNGFCYAKNSYFAKFLKVTSRTISTEVTKLNQMGCLKIIKHSDNNTRLIKTTSQNTKIFLPLEKNFRTYNNINNNSLSKDKQRFKKRLVKSGNSLDKKKRRVIAIKPVDENITKLIDHWNTLGQPFAKVVKREPVEEILKKVLKDNKPIEIESIFTNAYEYFNNPYFIFAGSKIRCHDFFVNNHHGFPGKWVKENKFDNWFEIFLKKGNTWLDLNLLKQPKDTKKYSKELYNSLCQVLQTNPSSRDDQIIIKRIANKAQLWLEKNNTQDYQWPLVDDLSYFIKEQYPDIRKLQNHWLVSRQFWNKTFNQYLVKIGRFEHINQIKRI